MEEINVGLIGGGPWGKNHARIYHGLENTSLKWVADIDQGRLDMMRKKYGVNTTRDYKEILEDSEIGAVSICVPAALHYKFAKEALLAGKDVLVEKPFTMDSKEAQELVNLAQSEKRVLGVGQVFRYDPAIQMVGEKIRDGFFGDIYYLSLSRLGLKKPREDVGAIFNYAIHDLDIMCDVLDKEYPDEINASVAYSLRREYEDLAVISARFGRTLGYTQVSWLTPRKYRDFWVVGEKRSATVDTVDFEVEVYESGIVPEYADFKGFRHITKEGESYKISPEKKEPLKEELMDFIGSVRTRKAPRASAEVGLRTVKMAEAALLSAKKGRAIELDKNGNPL